MKRVIDQRRYDTDTAKEIGTAGCSDPSDFNWWSETLYQKRTGEFFLHGEGGPLSRYAEQTGQNEWQGSEQLIPLNFDRAREWAEENLDADDYEAAFGEVSEDGGKVVTSISISTSTKGILQREAGKTGKTMSELIEQAVLDTYK